MPGERPTQRTTQCTLQRKKSAHKSVSTWSVKHQRELIAWRETHLTCHEKEEICTLTSEHITTKGLTSTHLPQHGIFQWAVQQSDICIQQKTMRGRSASQILTLLHQPLPPTKRGLLAAYLTAWRSATCVSSFRRITFPSCPFASMIGWVPASYAHARV